MKQRSGDRLLNFRNGRERDEGFHSHTVMTAPHTSHAAVIPWCRFLRFPWRDAPAPDHPARGCFAAYRYSRQRMQQEMVTESIPVRQNDVAQLVGLAAEGLRSMYDDREGIFCARVSRSGQGLRRQGHSFAGSLVATLGLAESGRRGHWTAFSTDALAQELIQRRTSVRSTAELGLLLWMTARTSPHWLDRIYEGFDLRLAVDAFADGRRASSRSLAWLLTGLCEVRLAGAPAPITLDDVAHLTRQLLFVNYGGHGIFAHQGRKGLLSPKGYLADQAFALYAFCRYARAYGDESSLRVARDVADRLVRSQGPTGQWWWRFDPATGQVAAHYPVMSVHQYALAPMALIEHSQLSGADHAEALTASLAWVRFGNERKVDLVDAKRKVVWDGLQLPRTRLLARRAGLSIKASVIEECRPEHLGWLLVALAGSVER